MMHSKLIVALSIITMLAFVVVGEEIVSTETVINSSNITEETSLEILPIEETTTEITAPVVEENIVAIQPIEEAAPVVEEPVPVENASDSLTGSLVIEPVIEQQSILKIIMELVLDAVSVIRGQIVQLTASLFYEDGTPAVDKEVRFFAGEENIGSDLTDEAGKAQFFWNTSPYGANVYVISAEYAGEQGVVSEGKNIVITEKLPTVVNKSPLTAMAVVEPEVSGAVEKIESCAPFTYYVDENVYSTCTANELVCVDAPLNTSCSMQVRQYQCITGVQKVAKTAQQCTTTKLRVNNGQKIIEVNLKEYECSYSGNTSSVIVICDSRYDGNGDGVCNSGESCQKIVVAGGSVNTFEKNSEDEYLADDDSYFMPEVGVEVIQ